MSDEGGQPETQRRVWRFRTPRQPEDRRKARVRLLAIAGAEVAFLLLVAVLVAQLQPGLVSQLSGQLADRLPSGLARPTATAHPAPTLAPLPTATPAPSLPGARSTGDFPTYLGYEGTGYNPSETWISAATAPSLKLFWAQHGASTISTQPTVANGLIYWGDWYGNEHATTLAGQNVWSTYLGRTWPGVLDPCGFSYEPNPGIGSTASSATISGRSMVFMGGGTGQLAALDALTGQIVWQTQLGDYAQGFVWSSPAVYGGSVYAGLASFSDCPLIRGEVVRLDAATGTVQNIFYVVPAGCVGGTVWSSPVIDPTAGYLYIATGGPNVYGGPCWDDGPYASAILKFRASDLQLVDSWQVPPAQEAEDDDFGNTVTLFSYTDRAGTHEMLGITHKNGIFYAFDRTLLGRGPIWERSVSTAATLGIYSPASFDGNQLYVTGSYTTVGKSFCSFAIRALDPRTGADVWARCLTEGLVYGAVTTAPGVVVVGAGPYIVVMSSETGATLFRYRDPGGYRFYGAATITHGLLLEGNSDGTLFAFGVTPAGPR